MDEPPKRNPTEEGVIGLVMVWGANFAVFMLATPLFVYLLGTALGKMLPERIADILATIPLWPCFSQWMYVIPLIRWARKSGRLDLAQGMIVAASLTLLLNGTCAYLVRGSW